MRSEAALIIGAVTTLIAAVITYLLGDGGDPGSVTDAVVNVLVVLTPLVAGLVTRGAVYSKATVERGLSKTPALVEGLIRTQGLSSALESLDAAKAELLQRAGRHTA